MKVKYVLPAGLSLYFLFLSCNNKLRDLRKNPARHIHGYVAPGFEDVKEVFIRNFRTTNEIGASVCAYYKGEKVVDLWGGYRNKHTLDPWEENTMAVIFSTTKGVCALAMNVAYSRGYFDYDDKVSKYWPEFAAKGKGNITIRQLLNHEAGLVLTSHRIPIRLYNDPDTIASILANVKPMWEPGTKHGYHIATLGSYISEIIRRTDPRHRTVAQFIEEEFCIPLQVKIYIGLPDTVPDSRIAQMDIIDGRKGIKSTFKLPLGLTLKFLTPHSPIGLALKEMAGFDPNKRETWRIPFPSAGGISNARNLARLYSEFATGANTLHVSAAAIEKLKEPARLPPGGPKDEVMGIDEWYSLGFLKSGNHAEYGLRPSAFGWPGAGGSFAFADPDYQLGFAYVMNYMDVFPLDPKEIELHKAVYRCIDKLQHSRN